MKKPVVLLIRDGWGHHERTANNAPVLADTPYTDYLKETYPWTLIEASEEAVGLPKGFFGNSEVGHMTLGAGRKLKQPLLRINQAVNDESLREDEAVQAALEAAEEQDEIHLMGLVQEEGVHADLHHLLALISYVKDLEVPCHLHLFTDGRDAPIHASIEKIQRIQSAIRNTDIQISTVSGRYYAMDRDHNWDRTEKAYRAIHGEGNAVKDPLRYIKEQHDKRTGNEFIQPAKKKGYKGANKDAPTIFFNFRGDRPRQLTKAFIQPSFEAFPRERHTGPFVTMTKYYDDVSADNLHVVIPRLNITNTFGEYVSQKGYKQLRIAESEKYPHVTYFFNGRIDHPHPGEKRIHIDSPDVPTYDEQPEMSLFEVTDALLKELKQDEHDFIIVNYANGDMVGHTGDLDAAVKAAEAVDTNTERLVEAVLDKDGTVFVTADHGNCDIMTGQYRTSHTLMPVEFIRVSNDEKGLRDKGSLTNVAATLLEEKGVKAPIEFDASLLG